MPQITDPPPPEVAAELVELRSLLDETIPRKVLDHNVLIATWNVRAFSDLTEKWQSGPDDSPKRDLHALRIISEIVSRFDVVALQEVRVAPDQQEELERLGQQDPSAHCLGQHYLAMLFLSSSQHSKAVNG